MTKQFNSIMKDLDKISHINDDIVMKMQDCFIVLDKALELDKED